MSEKDLDTLFKEAFEKASNMEQDSLPQDVMLRIYAYYKQATFGSLSSINYANQDVRDAFKNNAWLQVSHITEDEAKRHYIDLINEILNNKL
ncbi:acyl-CoA-binding protein [Flavobacterium humi]|uniref:Phosphatidylserine decarboxylase n=1 Tax=Flavobacterium humi TaxID=2562683 RepID=A0A4Z0L7M1_9FLAO|nr:acyl-CoA-binding protein [Flavobacterium humi]TGD58283.1 phosphatidylserine decarboxylase [Flavobacterium humi]